MRWTDSSELDDGGGAGVLLKSVAICEWDRQMYFALIAQGTTPQTYAPYLAYRDTSGTWASAGAFTNIFGSTITKTQLLGGISIVLSGSSSIGGADDTQIKDFLGRIYLVSGVKDDPAGSRTLIWYGSRAIASTSTMASDGDRILMVNKVAGTGIPDGSSYPSLSRSVEISEVSVYGTLGETASGPVHAFNGLTIAEFSDEIVYQQPLFKYSNKILADIHIGCSRAIESSDVVSANAERLVQIAYANTGSFTEGGDFCHVVSETSGSGMTYISTDNFRKHSTWLLGPGSTGFAASLGPDLSVVPRAVTCTLEGSKIRVMLQGNGRPFSATYKIETSSEEIDQVIRNQRPGVAS
jgi:hypothetical protein